MIPATGVHQGGEATCIEPAKCAVCEASYGTVNADNHKGETEIRDASPASCKDDGYTGDTYCKDCDKKIANGAVIPATGAHVDTDGKWESDGENHWHTCACGMKIDSAAHTGGEATCVELAKCAICEASYGTVNAENHKGETEIRGAYAGTCDTNGYSGDVYCKDCNVKLQDGTATPFEHLDENGDAYCDLCDVLLCKHNHVQVVNVKFENCVKDGYTGDTYCIDCGALLEKGDVTPATNRHTPGDWVVGKEATETEAGYLYQGCTVCGAKLATEVIPQLEAEWVNPFKDVSEDAWYYDDVKYAYVNGLMLGTDTNKFSPDMALSRAQLVTILWRLDDEAKAESAAFTDVADGMWYTEAIDWAAANGIVLGYNDGRFGPDDTITREQVMLILNRYAEYKGWTTDALTMDTVNYKYSTWAEKGVLWAAANGMFDGIGVDVTDLTVTADRAEITAYLKLFIENIAE